MLQKRVFQEFCPVCHRERELTRPEGRVIHKKVYEYGIGCIGVLIGSTMLSLMMGDNSIPTIIGGLFFLLVSLFFDWVRKRNSKG